jgi:plastocyanin
MSLTQSETPTSIVGRFARVLLVPALVLAMAACGDDEPAPAENPPAAEQPEEEEEEGGTVTVGDQEATDHGTEDVGGASEVELEADDFYFEPTVLTGEAGQEVTLTITNEGDAPHNFSITDQDIDENLDPGDETEVTVTFPDSGTVVFFCSFHQGNGMLGGLEVSS